MAGWLLQLLRLQTPQDSGQGAWRGGHELKLRAQAGEKGARQTGRVFSDSSSNSGRDIIREEISFVSLQKRGL